MMRMLNCLAVAATLATGAPAQVPGNDEVRAAAQAFADAQQHKDAAALERLLAPEFLYAPASGRVGDRKEFIAGFTAPGTSFSAFDISDPLFLRIAPDAAIVGGEAWIRGSDNGRPLAEHFRFSHSMVRREGRWMVAYTQVTPLPK